MGEVMQEQSGSAPRRRIVGLGEVLWDLFPDQRQPGGATANVAFHASQLGAIGLVVSRVGRDVLGREIVRHMADHGLVTTHIQQDADAPTGTVTVEMNGTDHRFTIHEQVAWDRLEWDPHVQAAMATADAVCVGTLAQRSPLSRETIQRCLFETREDCLIVFDINIRQHFYDRAVIERSLQSSNIVKLNADEVLLLADVLQLPNGDSRRVCEHLHAHFGVDVVCVTRGAEGCLLSDDGRIVDVPGCRVEVVDTVGAGDAFTAALLMSRLAGWEAERSASFANQVGALVASRAGAMPELRSEYQLLWKAFSERPIVA